MMLRCILFWVWFFTCRDSNFNPASPMITWNVIKCGINRKIMNKRIQICILFIISQLLTSHGMLYLDMWTDSILEGSDMGDSETQVIAFVPIFFKKHCMMQVKKFVLVQGSIYVFLKVHMCSATQCQNIPECYKVNSRPLSSETAPPPTPWGRGTWRLCVFETLFNVALKIMCLSTGFI